MAYKGRIDPRNLKHPEKYKGDLNNIVWRSLWERNALRWLDLNPEVVEYSSEEITIPYQHPIKNTRARYYPDLFIKFKDGRRVIVEIKPDKETRPPEQPKKKTQRWINEVATYAVNQQKWLAARRVCEDNGLVFEVWTEHDLHKLGIPTSSSTKEVRKTLTEKATKKPPMVYRVRPKRKS